MSGLSVDIWLKWLTKAASLADISDMGRDNLGNRVIWAILALAGACVAAHIVFLAAGMPPAWADAGNLWFYNGAIALSALACLARALVSAEQRGAWIAFAAGLFFSAGGDIYWTLEFADVDEIPYPSVADALYLAGLPCLLVGVLLLNRRRVGGFGAAQWIDAITVALATAAVGVVLLAPALIDLTHGDPAAVLTNLAYPLWDLIMIAFLAGMLVVGGVRGAGPMLLVGGGILLWTCADGLYLYQEATSGYEQGWIDALWTSGAFLIGSSAAFSLRHSPVPRERYRSPLWLTTAIAGLSVALLVWDHFEQLSAASVWLAGAALIAVAARLAVSFRESDALLAALHSEATTDALTGLANRRQLFSDLEHGLATATESRPLTLALFDLDGFKAYNDVFGHPAGDALLHRLGTRLGEAVSHAGKAYRLGGDEFCVLIAAGAVVTADALEAAYAALTARGDGFRIGASSGWAELPAAAHDAAEALRVVDQRMYAEKARRPIRVAHQTHQLLLRVIEGEPKLGAHGDNVARYADRMASALGLDAEERDIVHRAAELHDIGKIAIPDETLAKRGPLDESEWELMRRHTLIGERILGTAPALQPVAEVVRASHERWDGAGYPDGVANDQIPLGSRIVFVCDAFEVMTSERSYRNPIPEERAIAELRRSAGTQFDPALVDLFVRLWDAGELPRRPAGDSSNLPDSGQVLVD